MRAMLARDFLIQIIFFFYYQMLALSWDAPTVKLSEYMPTIPQDKNIVVAVGSMAHGTDDFADAYVDEKISVSDYSLSASVACGKITCAVEEIWGIV